MEVFPKQESEEVSQTFPFVARITQTKFLDIFFATVKDFHSERIQD